MWNFRIFKTNFAFLSPFLNFKSTLGFEVAVKAVSDLPIPIFVGIGKINDNGKMELDEEFSDLSKQLAEYNVDAILLMCSDPKNDGLPVSYLNVLDFATHVIRLLKFYLKQKNYQCQYSGNKIILKISD